MKYTKSGEYRRACGQRVLASTQRVLWVLAAPPVHARVHVAVVAVEELVARIPKPKRGAWEKNEYFVLGGVTQIHRYEDGFSLV